MIPSWKLVKWFLSWQELKFSTYKFGTTDIRRHQQWVKTKSKFLLDNFTQDKLSIQRANTSQTIDSSKSDLGSSISSQ